MYAYLMFLFLFIVNPNIALHKSATASSAFSDEYGDQSYYGASQAVDGSKSGDLFGQPDMWSCMVTVKHPIEYQWLSVDLGAEFEVATVTLTPRDDELEQLSMFLIFYYSISLFLLPKIS